MKKQLTSTTLTCSFIFLTLLFAVGCKKASIDEKIANSDNALSSARNGNEGNERPADSYTMEAFLTENAPQAEEFTINNEEGGVIVNSKGTRFTIPPNAFMDLRGNIPSGSVIVSIIELDKASEMVFSNRPTITTEGEQLFSLGEFLVKARVPSINNGRNDGEELDIAPGEAIRVELIDEAGSPDNKPLIWIGDTEQSASLEGFDKDNNPVQLQDPLPLRPGVLWAPNGENANPTAPGTFTFDLTNASTWVNTDVLMSYPGTKRTVMGNFGSNFNSATGQNYSGTEPTMLFFKVKGQPTVVKLYDLIAGGNGLMSYQDAFPEGMEGTFLAYSVIGGQFYAEMRDVTIPVVTAPDTFVNYTFNPTAVTSAQLATMIADLNTK
jgi:hypothetical protein